MLKKPREDHNYGFSKIQTMKKAENSLRTRKRPKIIKIPRKMCDWIIKMDVPLNNKSKYLQKNMG